MENIFQVNSENRLSKKTNKTKTKKNKPTWQTLDCNLEERQTQPCVLKCSGVSGGYFCYAEVYFFLFL